ncbi:hypothetical protein CfE428DRAFT_3267 [Chthoniobacter flavus Ellin428]|uniref:Uncharacterized protein n=1 Tax=Chthoniobacter flavus Ellin428 TaxID=497964 RepID=B4D2X9_9BACT|nr:hypothetical protein [Chthoniobacter flavus]EDY19090.1 hypothetical protein CfE428DRAFT_3267 [Chthoniobacter flavus Ellin428]TCO86851.1 hypothetical protein EV701_12668 [Chthoniobacter flavus]
MNSSLQLGGSVGIAILSTLITRREQFHDWRIGESITVYDPATQQRLAAMQANFISKGADTITAFHEALGALKQVGRRYSAEVPCSLALENDVRKNPQDFPRIMRAWCVCRPICLRLQRNRRA